MLSSAHGWPTRTSLALSMLATISCHGNDGPRYASEFTVVEVDAAAPATLQLAVQACAGLENRRLGGSVYIQKDANDAQWLADLGLAPSVVTTPDEFVRACVARFPKCVRYSYADQQALLPNILTVGTALGAVPLDVNLPFACSDVVFDAPVELQSANTPELATQLVFDRFVRNTTGLAMLDPGYDRMPADLQNPGLTRDMPSNLVDYVFSRRLFTVFLVNGCDSTSPENAVLSNVVNNSGWPTPLGVYGYNDSWFLGGYLWEAQTRCLDSRNMGAIATETGNLSFFSTRRPPITRSSELMPPPPESVTYDPSKTYVAFVVGDGDNVSYMMTSRKAWLEERVADCANAVNSCAPLTWSISPHLVDLAPDVLEWYANTSRATGRDYFTLPPSGHLYAYPSSLNEADQNRFVTATEQDARILGTRTTVHWDANTTWHDAEDHFLPKYGRASGTIQGIVAVNVPYVFPLFTWWAPEEFYRVLIGTDGTPVVLFRSREWRGVDDSDTEFFVSPQTMANQLSAYPAGTVTTVYMTSDGGLSLANSFMALVNLLPSNVQIVSADAAAALALTASGH